MHETAGSRAFPPRRRRALFAALALTATVIALLAGAPRAGAGTYRAVQCNMALGAGSADLTYHRSSTHYVGKSRCGRDGLTVRHVAGRKPTRGGRFGAWTLTAPAGAGIVRANVRVEGQGRAGHRPELTAGVAGNRQRRLARPAGALHSVRWVATTAARTLTARLRCVRRGHCGTGAGAFVALHRISVKLVDTIGPALGLGGPIYEEGSRRGTQRLEAIASDSGGGVRSVAVEVNGRTVASQPNGCAANRSVALRLRPCPEHVTASFPVQTASGPFRQGRNSVRVCASDFARDSVANRRCRVHTVRVDNLCPLSSSTATRLIAGFRGARSRLVVASDQRALLRGRLLDSAGRGVAGAHVCVASTVRGERSAPESVIATPLTDAEGGFRLRLPRGPNRAIRVAHWPDAQAALEQRLLLGSRVRPSLRMRPKRTIRNGKRVRFRVHLPSPAAAHRRVEVQARSGRRWVRVARGRSGTTGTWRSSYRFRATTGLRRYAFRAVVPHSRGYPFQSGRSRVRHVRVRGR